VQRETLSNEGLNEKGKKPKFNKKAPYLGNGERYGQGYY